MKINSKLNPTEYLTITTSTFQKHNNKSAIMASTNSNAALKTLPSTNQHIVRLATFVLASFCALLVIALRIQAVDAHSVADNAIQGPDMDGQHRRSYQENTRQKPQDERTMNNGQIKGSQFCDENWLWHKNKCWLFTKTRRPHSHASVYCAEEYHNATLPTIYNQDENNFLQRQMLLLLPSVPIWIGATYNHEYKRLYWAYKTPNSKVANWTNWDKGQPIERPSVICVNTSTGYQWLKNTDYFGKGTCVNLWSDGKWGTQIGCEVLLPVVCEKKSSWGIKYSVIDGPNDTSTSQYEQQQMFPVSSANTFNNNHHLTSIMYILTSLTIYATLNQQTVALVK